MMTNLFSSFNPLTIFNLSMNWFSMWWIHNSPMLNLLLIFCKSLTPCMYIYIL